MRRFLLLLLLVATPVTADEHALYLSAGVSVPTSPDDLSESVELGGGLSLGYGWRMGRLTELGLSVDYNRFKRSDEGLLLVTGLDVLPDMIPLAYDGGELDALDVLADFRFHLPSEPDEAFSIYLVGCAGVTWYELEQAHVDFQHTGHYWRRIVPGWEEAGFTLGGGAGFQNSFGRWHLYGEFRMLNAFAAGDDFVHWPVRLGLKVVFGG